jgi:hypothetical protein
MKSKKILFITLLGIALCFNSCKDDEKPAMKFSFEDNSISLSGANIYLLYSNNCCNNHDYRQYFISDGTYTEGYRGDVSSYTNGTYVIEIQLGVPGGTSFTPGDYHQLNWNDLGSDQLVSSIYLQRGVENEYIEVYSTYDESPITVSGGFNDGQKMTLKFNGTLNYYYFNGTNFVEDEVAGKLNFSGTVQDERPS